MTNEKQLTRRSAVTAAGLAAVGALSGSGFTTRAVTSPAATSRQRAGQRVVFSYPGLTVPDTLLERVRAGEAAGVIFFGENISDADQLADVARRLNEAAAQSPVTTPLLLLTDQEGGQVNRLPGAPEPSAKEVGRSADPVGAATATGSAAGANLRGAGLNVNLAPVLGVYRQEGGFLDGKERSYGTDPATVGRLAGTFVGAQREAGVAGTAKHFPGLGAAGADANTDLAPVSLDIPLRTLREVDEAPYRAAINAGAQLVMPSWAVYPALDANRPAGLSPTVINEELRGRFGFTAVTVTDALEAGALQAYGSPAERGLLAAAAGMDLLLASARDVNQGDEVVTGLAGALDSGELDDAAFTAATDRIAALRNSLR